MHDFRTTLFTLCPSLLLLTLGACGQSMRAPTDSDAPTDGTDDGFRSGMSAQALVDADSDTGYVRYEISECGGAGAPIVLESDLQSQSASGAIELGDNPLDAGSAHRFSNMFQVLVPGCYDLLVRPMQADGTPSAQCTPANKNAVAVTGGQTSVVQLMMQCSQEDRGALDAIVSLNHAPLVTDIQFEDTSFVCGDSAQVCVTATDVDGDPLDIEIQPPTACSFAGPSSVTGTDSTTGIERCFELACSTAGRHEMVARAFDQVHEDGELIRIEDWLAREGYANQSRSELAFPIFFDCLGAGDIVPASTNFAGSAYNSASRLIDGSGLSDEPELGDRLHWAGAGGENDDSANFKAPATQVVAHPIDFDLGAEYQLSEVLLWNYTHSLSFYDQRDVRHIEISVSVDGVDYTPVTTIDLPGSGLNPELAHGFDLVATTRYVRFQVLDGHGDTWAHGQEFGLGEVRFR